MLRVIAVSFAAVLAMSVAQAAKMYKWVDEKPAFLLKTQGYWDPLLRLFGHMVEEGFVGRHFLDFLTVAGTVDELMAALRRHLP